MTWLHWISIFSNKTCSNNSLFTNKKRLNLGFYFYLLCVCLSTHSCIYAFLECWCPQSQNWHWIPWSWSFRWLWITLWVLDTELRSSAKTASTFNLIATFPASVGFNMCGIRSQYTNCWEKHPREVATQYLVGHLFLPSLHLIFSIRTFLTEWKIFNFIMNIIK